MDLELGKVAIWVVEGLILDKLGCGFIRIIGITSSEIDIPSPEMMLRALYPSEVVWTQIDKISLFKISHGKFRPTSAIPEMYDMMYNFVTSRASRRIGGKWVKV